LSTVDVGEARLRRRNALVRCSLRITAADQYESKDYSQGERIWEARGRGGWNGGENLRGGFFLEGRIFL